MKKRIFAIVILALMLLPMTCLPAFAAGDQLPDGFVSMDKVFRLEDGDGTQPGHYSKVDGFYLVLEYMTSSTTTIKGYRGDVKYGMDLETNEYRTSSQSISGHPSLCYTREQVSGEASVSGTFDFSQNTTSFGVVVFKSSVSVTVSNVSFEDYNCYGDISGHLNASGGRNGTYESSEDIDLTAEHLQGTYKRGDDGTIYLMFSVGAAEQGYGLSGISLWFRIAGVLPKGQASVSGVTQNAEETPDEDGGVYVPGNIVDGDNSSSVPAAIAIGVLGGGAAIAGAAASAGSSDDKKKKRKAYKMYVQKDFGDAIRRGADKPVTIRARMAEVDPGGAERGRNDLTAKISAEGSGMTIHSTQLSGRYLEAVVSIPQEYEESKASITFTFTGEGGSFTNTVVFRVIDGPSFRFLEETKTPGQFIPYHENCGISAIPGDNFTYTEHFMIEDAPTAPKLSDITAVNTGEFDVSFELTGRSASYKMIVKNNTAPETEHDIFAKVREEHFEIHVNVEGEKDPVKGYVTMRLYPEGITIESDFEGRKNDVRYIRVQAYEKDYAGDLDNKWQVSEIKFTLTVKGEDKALIDPKTAQFSFDKLKGAGGRGTKADTEQSIAEKYEYSEAFGEWNDRFLYTFSPNAELCEPEDGSFFMVLLPASAEYEGRKYEAEIPLRLVGRPLDPMAAWEKEYNDLVARVEKFALPDNRDQWVERINRLAYEDPKCSVVELRLTSKYLIRQYMRYWTIESMKYKDEAEIYDIIVDYLEWAKFFGDVAFSILVTIYAGALAEALISPAKDFFTGAIGEVIAAWNYGQEIDIDKFEFSKNLAAAGDNVASGVIDFKNWKMAAATLGCYFAYASIKNFLLTLKNENKFDLYGAVVKGFSDLTSAALKAAAGQLFGAWLKNCSKFRAKVSVWCGQFVTKNLGAGKFLDMRNMDALTREGILRKYLDSLFGMAVDKLLEVDGEIHDNLVKSMSDFRLNENGDVIITFFFDVLDKHYTCSVNATKALTGAVTSSADLLSGGLFSFVYDELFGNIPAASAVATIPKDPPLPPANK